MDFSGFFVLFSESRLKHEPSSQRWRKAGQWYQLVLVSRVPWMVDAQQQP